MLIMKKGGHAAPPSLRVMRLGCLDVMFVHGGLDGIAGGTAPPDTQLS